MTRTPDDTLFDLVLRTETWLMIACRLLWLHDIRLYLGDGRYALHNSLLDWEGE